MPKKQDIEIREISFSPNDLQDDNSLNGLAIAYRSDSKPLFAFYMGDTFYGGEYIERIMPGAATESMANNDVKCLHQHDSKYVLGRTQNKTLELNESIDGLYFKVAIPDTTWAKDLATSVRRGDVDKMSFGFKVVEETWLTDKDTISIYDMPVREISKIELREISIVSNPAYPATAVRDLDDTSQENINQSENTNKYIDIESEARARKIAMLKTRI